MSSHGSVTRWYRELEQGNDDAASQLWNRFFGRIVRLAGRRLGSAPRQVSDEEDVALSAFKSLCRGIRDGRFPTLAGRDELWRLLIVITTRKVQDQITHERRLKRCARTPGPPVSLDDETFAREAVSHEPSPDLAVQMAETVEALLDGLEHDDLRTVAVMKLEGYTNVEIAASMNRGVATVERKLRTIRTIWEERT